MTSPQASPSIAGHGCDALIVDNGTNHVLFGQLARYLAAAAGLKIVYVTLLPARVSYFHSLGIEARVLDAGLSSDIDLAAGVGLISQIEARYPGYRLGLSIRRDRILRWYPRNRAERLISVTAARFDKLLAELKPRLVLGEVSWAIEHAFYHVASLRGIRYRHLLNLPGKELLVAPFDADHSASGTEYIGERMREAPQDVGKSYYELCGAVKGYRPSLGYFLRNFRMLYSPNDYRQALFYRIRRLFMPLYRVLQGLFEAWHAVPPPEDRQHVLLVLHVQPESTPDYVSPFHADQCQLAMNIAEALPSGQRLFVKDHPNVLSIRNLWRWHRLLRQGKVRLLSRRLPGRDLLPRFEVVVSIAGTALYECAKLGIPAVSLSNVFMNELPNVLDGRGCPNWAVAIDRARQKTASPLSEEDAQAFLSRFGMPGFIHDARIAPDVINPANIERLAKLVTALLGEAKAAER